MEGYGQELLLQQGNPSGSCGEYFMWFSEILSSLYVMNKENQVKEDKIYAKYSRIWLLTFQVWVTLIGCYFRLQDAMESRAKWACK